MQPHDAGRRGVELRDEPRGLADGVPATPVEYEAIVRQDRWPHAGQVLPVTVDRGNPTRVKVEWDEVRSHEDRIAEQAEAQAAQRATAASTSGNELVDQLRAAFPGAEITVSSHTRTWRT